MIIFWISILNVSLFMYSSFLATTIMLSTSLHDPIAMFKKFFSSLFEFLPQPSAMLFEIDNDALLSWELIA